MEQEIKRLKKLLKTGSEIEKDYALRLLTWLNNWLDKKSGPQPQDDGGNNPLPPPPPPRK